MLNNATLLQHHSIHLSIQLLLTKIVPRGIEVISWPWPRMTLKVTSSGMSHRP